MLEAILVLSYLLFIITYGIHAQVKSGRLERVMYLTNPYLSAIPVISGFLLSYVCILLLFEQQWFIVLIGNSVFVVISSVFISKQYLVRFASGDGVGKDMIVTFCLAIVLLLIVLIVKAL